ncbi:integration host factor subunit alpha [Buchnera aphidicola]|uniref:Integration host factor subunit alpha n=1 Tax=Buchnera aphidicola str. USDA (Myzus persicae) TaxID=1009856 RepID=W0P0I7_BUCMP|nr:integration host factor subunit alpha [Buchnera aphidicola]AHG60239.1 Ihfa [Buchnera aphidicola str. USDA (Myzus persicae)]AHG60817.1 Ihfa [Buchnera aphidicola str. W106 (Myzus persicae)]AHG61389.1 Ihfa [Buchnera aphidicola str. G002 (Myzus persicae)]AHG61962.1 Ihfa [Buchnera aphidicola str. F009 (Myzus persicae)]WAI03072.1 MAG: integration host factor subunit alpha [Buchnera aphidicola (Myzus persicae)]
MVLTKAEISENLFEKLQLTKKDSKKFVDFFFEEVRKSLEKGEDVKLSGFGNFELKDKKERPGRNPRTGEIVLITARRVVTFKAGQKLKNRIENYSSNKKP